MPMGRHPGATVFEEDFPDGDKNLRVIDESTNAQHVYIVASLYREADFARVRRVADHYLNTLNAEWVTLITPYMGSTRQDKNVDRKGHYTSNTLNIRSDLGSLSGVVHRIIVCEPHSSATQTYAAQLGIPLAPLSPWKPVMEELIKDGVLVPGKRSKVAITPDNAVVIGPDRGRNLAATRIAEHFALPYVSLDKVRDTQHDVFYHDMSKADQEIVQGKIAISYDDEGSTFGTASRLASALQRYGMAAFAMGVVHGKLTHRWRDNIAQPLLTEVLITDSREPISKIGPDNSAKVRVMTLTPFLYQVVEADIEGLNFWNHPELSSLVIQTR